MVWYSNNKENNMKKEIFEEWYENIGNEMHDFIDDEKEGK